MKKFKTENGRWFVGDCLKLLKKIPDNYVNMIICDLPYGIVNWSNPYEWDKAFDLKALFKQYKRIIKKNGAIVLFGTEPYSTFQRNMAPTLFKYDIIWVKNKTSSFFTAKVKPLRSYEIISIFSEGTTSPGRKNNMPYNPQGLTKQHVVKNNSTKRNKASISVQPGRPSLKKTYVQKATGYPRDVVYFDSHIKGFHPTQKPVDLFKYLIKTFTNKGEKILDNCAGSGTAAIAAEMSKRKWICMEKDKEYSKLAIRRIRKYIRRKGN